MNFTEITLMILMLGLSACGTISEPAYKIISTCDDKTVENILNEANENTLVIFDCDEVLITPNDVAFSPKNVKNTYNWLVKYLNERMDRVAADEVIFNIREQCSFRLVNENCPKIIRNLQSNGVKTAILTAHWTGELHGRPHIEELRKNELKTFEFNLKKSWSDIEKIVFNELPATSHHYNFVRYPIFDEGIIFSCNLEKGVVLNAFLQHVPYKFSKIIFVDDKRKNVESVLDMCKKIGISCIGVEYKKVEIFDDREITFEELKPRVDNFIKTKKW